MKIALQGGPSHDKTWEVPNHMTEIVVPEIQPINWSATEIDPEDYVPIKKHLYTRTKHTDQYGYRLYRYAGTY